MKVSLEALEKAPSINFDFTDIGEISGNDVIELRKSLGLTQLLFAKMLHISKKTVEKWEENANPIKGTSAVLIYLLKKDKYLARDLVRVIARNQPIPEKYSKLNDLTIAECREICKEHKLCSSAQRTCPLHEVC